jgi:hypothetical protein
LQNTFTSQDAVALFKEHTCFEFHPTVPGQLLARCGIINIPSKSKPSRFDAEQWDLVWQEMFLLALRRCKFDRSLQPPTKCFAPMLPQSQETNLAVQEKEILDLEPHPTRRFLEVPFEEKDEAKWRGARWDWDFKKWYVPSGMNRNVFPWPDALLTPAMRAVEFPSDEPGVPSKRRARKKKAGPQAKSNATAMQLEKEIDERLQFLLNKPE